MHDVVFIDGLRTAFGRRHGKLKDWHPVRLLSRVVGALLEQHRIDPAHVDHFLAACVVQQGEQAVNLARNAWIDAGLSIATAATTIDRQCCGAEQAIHFAHGLIASGTCDLVVVGGVESMTRVVPTYVRSAWPFPPGLEERQEMPQPGPAAGYLAEKYRQSRLQLDEYSQRSHLLAAQATRRGHFEGQILPLELAGPPPESFFTDEGIRNNSSVEKLLALEPAFRPDHPITAGNSSQASDGAAAVVIASAARARQLGLRPRARLVALADVGSDPRVGFEGLGLATQAVLKRASLDLKDINLFEVHESFAAAVLAWQSVIGASLDRVNVNGGAIAIGHPQGASGCRLLNQLVSELERRDLRRGLMTMASYGGMGSATIIERLPPG
jgi:acetyl-CoA acetyltransferase family protein